MTLDNNVSTAEPFHTTQAGGERSGARRLVHQLFGISDYTVPLRRSNGDEVAAINTAQQVRRSVLPENGCYEHQHRQYLQSS